MFSGDIWYRYSVWVSTSVNVDRSEARTEWDSRERRVARNSVVGLSWLEALVNGAVAACIILSSCGDRASPNSNALNAEPETQVDHEAVHDCSVGKVYTHGSCAVQVDDSPGALDKHFSFRRHDSVSL